MLSQIRYQQQYRQIQSQSSIVHSDLATYDSRDPVTGKRIVKSADGGEQYTEYLSNSVPNGTLDLARSSSIGLTGYINQRQY